MNTFGGYLGTVVGVISVCLIYVIKTKKKNVITVPIAILIVLSIMSSVGLVPSSGKSNIGGDFISWCIDNDACVSVEKD